VIEETGGLVRAKNHRLSVSGSGSNPAALADPQLLRQVIMNLVSNAIKYTPAGGEIAIEMRREGAVAQWSVRDTGIGVPAASRERLFEKFYRADNAVAIETEGTGLGLYLVRLIVERFGGHVWCESEEGRGSTFAFTVPAGNEGDDHDRDGADRPIDSER
jgi:two-component system phosphate regulon sensor histidine kinase PhoR